MATTQDPLSVPSNVPSSLDATYSGKERAGLKCRVSQMTDHVRNTASDFGRSAASNINRNLDKAADALERTSSALRSRTGADPGRMSRYAHGTADKLDQTARYFRDHHTDEMLHDVEHWARRKPAAALCTALGVGFAIGLLLKYDRRRH